ncbi:MAG: transcription initiation factor IIB [Candidatus Methanospirareceae archaeon]
MIEGLTEDKVESEEEKKEKEEYREEVKECPECKSKNLVRDYERAELFCADCGLVIDENIVDLGPEWRAFDFEQASKRARVGAPMTYRIHDKGLSSLSHLTSTFGKSISPTKSFRLKKWQMNVANTSERSFIFALSEMDRMASALGLPINIREAASMLYRKAMSKGLIRGRSIEAVSSAILYIVCRQYGVPRTLDEIKAVSRVSQKEISRAYRFLLRELDIKLPPASPADFVPRFCSKLGLDGEVRAKAIDIIKEAQEKELTNGRGPIGIAAAAIYIAAVLCGKHRTQKEISEVTGVTEVTIRNRYKELAEELDIGMLI